ncbi:MAG TPA: hypothetical protein VIH42_01910 [Thermoguttaceae bacterium]
MLQSWRDQLLDNLEECRPDLLALLKAKGTLEQYLETKEDQAIEMAKRLKKDGLDEDQVVELVIDSLFLREIDEPEDDEKEDGDLGEESSASRGTQLRFEENRDDILKKDYGCYLANSGVLINSAHYFYSVPVDHISILDINMFSMSSVIKIEGKEYAVTFDFDEYFLWKIMELAQDNVISAFQAGLKKGLKPPHTIDFPEIFYVGIHAVMGNPQIGMYEQFIPFNIKAVISA